MELKTTTSELKITKPNPDLMVAFSNKGLYIDQFVVGHTKPNGKCGAGSAALHIYQNEDKSGEVMSVLNKALIQYWDRFGAFFSFPLSHPIGVGRNPKLFNDYQELEDFLLDDVDANNLWMDYQWWQLLSNKFNITIHTLTSGSGAPRWTSVSHDPSLAMFEEHVKEVPDLYLIHSDENHFDILIHKNNPLMNTIDMKIKEKGTKDEKIFQLKK